MKTILLFAAVAASAPTSPKPAPTEGSTGLVYGSDHVFALTAPRGWVLDNKSGAEQGFHAVFYPVGQTWKDAPVIMYGNGFTKNGRSLSALLDEELKRFRADAPNLVMEDGGTLPTKGGKQAVVRHFSGAALGNHESVAYIEEPNVFVVLVMSARSKDDFKTGGPAFKELVGSYKFLGDKLTIKP